MKIYILSLFGFLYVCVYFYKLIIFITSIRIKFVTFEYNITRINYNYNIELYFASY